MTTLEKFIRWVVIPVSKLKEIPNGDGAFAAMSIVCALCERYHRIKTTSQDKWDDDRFLASAAHDLGVDEDFFEDFWDVFRNGLQHQMTPKWRSGVPAKNRKPYKWAISSSPSFSHAPTIRMNKAGEQVICIDPWRFTSFWISRFLESPTYLDDAVHHAFGGIFDASEL